MCLRWRARSMREKRPENRITMPWLPNSRSLTRGAIQWIYMCDNQMQSKSQQISPNSFQHTIKLPASRTTFANHAYIYIYIYIYIYMSLKVGKSFFPLLCIDPPDVFSPTWHAALFAFPPRPAVSQRHPLLSFCASWMQASSRLLFGVLCPLRWHPLPRSLSPPLLPTPLLLGVYALFPQPLFQLLPGVGRHVGTCKAFWWKTAKSCHIKIVVVSKSCTILGT